MPHSKQHAFKREVIKLQDGHIVCDPNPAISFTLRILYRHRIVNSAITTLKEILIALINPLLLGDFRIACPTPYGDGAVDFTAFHVLVAIHPLEVFS